MSNSDHRITEMRFRDTVPVDVGNTHIWEIVRFDPGSFQRYEYAAAIVVGLTGGRWSTHRLIYRDDKKNFFLDLGHYDITNRQEAFIDARNRTP